MTNYYEILGVQPHQSDTDIKKAFRKLSLKFHPDKNPGDAYFEDWAKKINEAFEVLGNPATRAAYDRQLSGNAKEAEQSLKNHFNHPQAEATVKPEEESKAQQVTQAEKLVLGQLNEMLPDYLQLKQEWREARLEYVRLQKKKAPLIFTPKQLVIGSLVLLFAIAGLVYASFTSHQELEKARVLKPLPGKASRKDAK